MSNLFDLKDRIIVVTGGLGQLGRQYTRSLHAASARVVVFDIPDEEEAAGILGPELVGENVLYAKVDVTQKESIERGLEKVKARWGIPHGLVNNAAIDSPPNAPAEENGPFETYPEASFDSVMNVNVKGVVLACQLIGGAMAQEGRGSIINICSTYGVVSPDQRIYEYRHRRGEIFYKPVSYSVSKSSLVNLTRYLATYWGERNVRVNTLTLGGVSNNQEEELVSAYNARTPLGRMAKEDEYNGAIIFLLSDASSYMTGANLVIDGGWTAW